MSGILIVILLVVVVFVAASVVLSRTTRQVGDARGDEYLELEGSWIRYRVTGEGPPVVLVHGWLSSGRIWEPLAERLAERFTVYALDLSGFGESDKPISGYGVRYGSRLLYAFCAHFGLARAAVIGHDFGGTMAVKLAADHQDVVGRLVLVATPANENQIDLPTFLWLSTMPVLGPISYTLGRFFRPLRRLWMRPFVLDPQDLTEEVLEDAGKSTPAAVTKTFNVARREISRDRLVRQAGIIKLPVLAIAGEEDQIVDPQATNNWARTVSAEVVLMDECGHLPMLEHTVRFSAQVLAFLTGDPRYLDAIPEPPQEAAHEEDVPLAQTTPEEPAPLPEPDDTDPSPTVIRKQGGRYPPRDRDDTDKSTGQEEEFDDSSIAPPAAGDDDDEKRPSRRTRPRRDRDAGFDEDGTVGPLPEMPKDLFDWPESLEQSRDRFPKTSRQGEEERGGNEAEDPESKEERSR